MCSNYIVIYGFELLALMDLSLETPREEPFQANLMLLTVEVTEAPVPVFDP